MASSPDHSHPLAKTAVLSRSLLLAWRIENAHVYAAIWVRGTIGIRTNNPLERSVHVRFQLKSTNRIVITTNLCKFSFALPEI